MNAVVTGANGTVGSVLKTLLEKRGDRVVGWDRAAVSVDDPRAMEEFLQKTDPEVLFHLAIPSKSTGRDNEGWIVNVEWPTHLARITKRRNIPLVFTSSVMVFTDAAKGPFTIDSVPDAKEGYGFEKRTAEARVREANADARIVRLGWQIGTTVGSNNMIDFLERKMREDGRIQASRRWLTACSFLEDTAGALARLANMPPGLYQLDSNERWSFFEIVSALKRHRGAHWNVEPSDDFVYDQRMIDPRPAMPSLCERLSELAMCGPSASP